MGDTRPVVMMGRTWTPKYVRWTSRRLTSWARLRRHVTNINQYQYCTNEPGDDHPRRVADGRSSKKSKSTASHHVHRADGIGLGVVLLDPVLHPHSWGLGFPEHSLAIHQRYSEINNEYRQCDHLTITYHCPKVMSHQSYNLLFYHGLGLGTWKKWFSKAFKVLNKA